MTCAEAGTPVNTRRSDSVTTDSHGESAHLATLMPRIPKGGRDYPASLAGQGKLEGTSLSAGSRDMPNDTVDTILPTQPHHPAHEHDQCRMGVTRGGRQLHRLLGS